MAVFEILGALANLDVGFLVDFATANIFWVFAFYCIGFFFSDKKAPLITGLIGLFVVLGTMDVFNKLIGFSIYTAYGLGLIYLGRLAVLTVLENSKYRNYLPLAYVIVFFTVVGWVALGSG